MAEAFAHDHEELLTKLFGPLQETQASGAVPDAKTFEQLQDQYSLYDHEAFFYDGIGEADVSIFSGGGLYD